MKISMNNRKISINGQTFTGNNVSIVNGKITIDGVAQSSVNLPEINITIEGDVDKIELGAGKIVAGNVGCIQSSSGDIKCGDVLGSITAMSGSITCGNVGGNATTMSGDIIKR